MRTYRKEKLLKSPFNREPNDIDVQTRAVLARMTQVGPDSDEYDKHLKTLKKLAAIKTLNRSNRPSSDTVLIVLGNLAGIIAILSYEQTHVLVSKAFATILKVKT